MLVRFACLAVAHAFAALRLLLRAERKDVEILALRHQLTILQRQLGGRRPQLRPEDRMFLSILLVPLSRAALRRLRLLVSPDTVVLRLAAENPAWGYRRIHGQLALLGIEVAPSTVWEILKAEGVDSAPQRTTVRWADFLRSQAEAVLAMDFIETITLTGQRQYILAAIHHAGWRIRILGTTAHPTQAWVTQAVRNPLMDLEGVETSRG